MRLLLLLLSPLLAAKACSGFVVVPSTIVPRFLRSIAPRTGAAAAAAPPPPSSAAAPSPPHAAAAAPVRGLVVAAAATTGGILLADDPETHAAAGVEIRSSPGKGMGAFAARAFPTNAVVGDYSGEVLTAAQHAARYGGDDMTDSSSSSSSSSDGNNNNDDGGSGDDAAWAASRLERGVGMTGDYVVQVTDDLFVDAEDPACSSWCRYLNHASGDAANVALKCLPFGMDGRPRVWFTALRDIAAGEEVCFNYDGSDGTYWKEGDDVAT